MVELIDRTVNETCQYRIMRSFFNKLYWFILKKLIFLASNHLVLKDLDEILFAKDVLITEGALDAAGVLYVPDLNSIEDYQPILCKTSESDHAYYGSAAAYLYTDHSVTATFYDISYNVWTDTTIKNLFLRATMKGSNTESPLIRSLRLLHE